MDLSPADIDASCYCLAVQRAARRLARLYDDALRPHGLTHGQFSLLVLVAGLEPVSIATVAQALVMDRTTVTALAKPLQRRGLLRVQTAASDARLRLLQLAPAAPALLDAATTAWQAMQQRVQQEAPDAALRAGLRRLAGRLPRRA